MKVFVVILVLLYAATLLLALYHVFGSHEASYVLSVAAHTW